MYTFFSVPCSIEDLIAETRPNISGMEFFGIFTSVYVQTQGRPCKAILQPQAESQTIVDDQSSLQYPKYLCQVETLFLTQNETINTFKKIRGRHLFQQQEKRNGHTLILKKVALMILYTYDDPRMFQGSCCSDSFGRVHREQCIYKLLQRERQADRLVLMPCQLIFAFQ